MHSKMAPNWVPRTALTDAQESVVQASEGATVVTGGPRSGKTTALLHAYAERIQGQPSSVLFLTHSRPDAVRLRNLVQQNVDVAGAAINVQTPYAFANWVLASLGDDWLGFRLLTAPQQEVRLRELLTHTSVEFPVSVRAAVDSAEFARQVRQLLARARQKGLAPEDLERFGLDRQMPEWVSVGRFMAEYLDVLDAEQVIDYAELIYRAELLLANDSSQRWRCVIVDEYPEFDAGMIRLTAAAARLAPQLIVAGDPRQGVSDFRGGLSGAIRNVAKDFSFGKPEVITCSDPQEGNAGLSAAIAGLAATIPTPAGFVPPEPTANANGVQIVRFDLATQEIEWVARELSRLRATGRYEWRRMAVITRDAAGATALARILSSRGVPVTIPGDEIVLADEPAVSSLINAAKLSLALAEEQPVSHQQVLETLQSMWGRFDPYLVRSLARLLGVGRGQESPTWSDWLRDSNAAPAAEPQGDERRAWAAFSQVRDELWRAASSISNDKPAADVAWQLLNAGGFQERLRTTALAGDSDADESVPRLAARRANHDLDALCELFRILESQQHRTGAAGMRHLIAEVAAQSISVDSRRDTLGPRDAVTVLTAGRAKGQTWPLVVMPRLTEGNWPKRWSGPGLLAPDELLSTSTTGQADQLWSEYRLAYVAMSRATEQLILTCSTDENLPSRFLAKILAERIESPAPSASSLQDLALELRQIGMNPSASPGLRAAVGVRLARLETLGDLAPPAARRASWWGTADITASAPSKTIHISPSQLESILSCPLKWFVTSRLSGTAGSDEAREIGNLIHHIAAESAAKNWTLDEAQDCLRERWQLIHFEAQWRSATRLADAQAAIRSLYRWRRQTGALMRQTEAKFELRRSFDEHEVVLRGSVDELFVDSDGQTHIADFKTGANPVSVPDGKRSLQLGCYQYAANAGAIEGATGKVASASLVYLFKPRASGEPTTRVQPGLDSMPWPDGPECATGHENFVEQALAGAAQIVGSGTYDAIAGQHCRGCPLAGTCPEQRAEQGVWHG